jgi:predicted DNA-binding transcriptional regulator AlpA
VTKSQIRTSRRSEHRRRHHLDKKAEALAAMHPQADGADDLLTSDQVAAWLGVSRQFVELSRIKNYGPPFTRLSARCIRYRRSDVAAWLRDRTHSSTAEYSTGGAPEADKQAS